MVHLTPVPAGKPRPFRCQPRRKVPHANGSNIILLFFPYGQACWSNSKPTILMYSRAYHKGRKYTRGRLWEKRLFILYGIEDPCIQS